MFQKIAALIETLDVDERSVLKTALSRQIEGFFDEHNNLFLSTDDDRVNFNLLATSLRKLAPNSDEIPYNGIVYYGRPDWLTQELLMSLITEAEERRLQPLEKIDHFLGCGGYYADKLATSDELFDFVTKYGSFKKTGIASYIYYDIEGFGIKPHVDTDVFSLNIIIMLKHECPENEISSATAVFPADHAPEYYRLKIGEVLIMYGSSTIHTRTTVKKGENVQILTIGFKPII